MGMQKDLGRTENKVKGDLKNCYFNISNVRIEGENVQINVRGYIDEAARRAVTSEERPGPMDVSAYIFEKNYTCKTFNLPAAVKTGLSEINRFKHVCYLWLKQQGDFSSASDIFEAGQ
jgi:hypothetical protein